jgi:hypothetical protein
LRALAGWHGTKEAHSVVPGPNTRPTCLVGTARRARVLPRPDNIRAVLARHRAVPCCAGPLPIFICPTSPLAMTAEDRQRSSVEPTADSNIQRSPSLFQGVDIHRAGRQADFFVLAGPVGRRAGCRHHYSIPPPANSATGSMQANCQRWTTRKSMGARHSWRALSA